MPKLTLFVGGVESPHVDLIEETDTVNFTLTDTDTFTCSFNASGHMQTVTPILPTYTVTLTATNGTVTGAGTYTQGTVITISATASSGYKFSSWSDGDTNASRSITVNSDITLSASFEEKVTETWYFNCPLSRQNSQNFTNISFTSNNRAFNRIYADLSTREEQWVYYYDDSSYVSAYYSENQQWYPLQTHEYQTIILDEPATGDLLTFLQANATKQ